MLITLERLLDLPDTQGYWIRAICGARKTLRYKATSGIRLSALERETLRELNLIHDSLAPEARNRAFQNPKPHA